MQREEEKHPPRHTIVALRAVQTVSPQGDAVLMQLLWLIVFYELACFLVNLGRMCSSSVSVRHTAIDVLVHLKPLIKLRGGNLPILKHFKEACTLFDLSHKVLSFGVFRAVYGGHKLVHVIFIRADEVTFLVVVLPRLSFTCKVSAIVARIQVPISPLGRMPRNNAKRFEWVGYIELLEQVRDSICLNLSIRNDKQVFVVLLLVFFGVVLNKSIEADVPFLDKLVKALFEELCRIIAYRRKWLRSLQA